MSVRVLAGAARGRRLRVPTGGRTRPTASMVREALFGMLTHRGWLEGRLIVDLFAGSGALGIEAASRGAARVVFVEESRQVARVLRGNLEAVPVHADVWVMPVSRALGALARRGIVAGGMFADPPYDRGLVAATVAGVMRAGVLAPGGWLAIEHAVTEQASPVPGLRVAVARRYGSTALTLLEREEVVP